MHLDPPKESTRGLTETLEGVLGEALEGTISGEASGGSAWDTQNELLNKLQSIKSRGGRRRGVQKPDHLSDDIIHMHVMSVSKHPMLKFVLRSPMILTNALLAPLMYRFIILSEETKDGVGEEDVSNDTLS